MKLQFLTFLCFLIFGSVTFFSCQNTNQKSYSDKIIEISDSCDLSPKITYEIYMPKIDAKCADMPLLIVIDPKGDGKLAVKKFKKAARHFNCIILASNSIKNGSQEYIATLNILFDDARVKYSSGKVLFLAGFSGGARMVLNYAQYYPVNGIIVCGALATPEQLKSIKFPIMCIIGMADFNFVEAAQYIFNPEQAPSVLNLQFTEDTHAWPGENTLNNAVGMLILNQNNYKECALVKGRINDFAESQIHRCDSLLESKNYIEAGLLARNLSKIENTASDDRLKTLEYSTDFNNALNSLRESIRFELTVRNAYYSALNYENLEWWKQEIASLNKNILEEKDPYRNFALRRIKGFLGIMCYSLCNNSLRNNDLSMTERLLAIYALIEPENPDMYYFSALFDYKTGHPDRVRELLKRAIQLGFSDSDRMRNDFPEEIISLLLLKMN